MKHRKLSLETLTARQLMANNVFEIENNDTEARATPFRVTTVESTVLKGTSTSKDDKDYFAFTAGSSNVVSVAVNATSSAALEVTTRAGTQLLETEPNNGVHRGTFQSTAGETYLLRVRSTSKSAAEYSVEVALGSSIDNSTNPGNSGNGTGNGTGTGGGTSPSAGRITEVEPNDKVSEAQRLQLGSDAITLTGQASKKDRDFFQLTPTSNGSVTLSAPSRSIKVSVETTTGTKLFETEPNDGVTGGSFNITAGVPVVVRVRGLTSTPTSYEVTLTPTATGTATPQPATQRSSARTPVQWIDTNDDGNVTPLDALIVVNHLSRTSRSAAHDSALLQLDVNDDSMVSPLDALLVVNHLSRSRSNARKGAEGEAAGPTEKHSRDAWEAMSDSLTELERQRNRRRGA